MMEAAAAAVFVEGDVGRGGGEGVVPREEATEAGREEEAVEEAQEKEEVEEGGRRRRLAMAASAS